MEEAPHLFSGGPLNFVAMGWKKLSQQAAASIEADPEPPFRPLAQPQKPRRPKPLTKRTNDPGIGTGLTELIPGPLIEPP